MEMNEILEKLPKHLMNLVIDQPYNEYTSQDHALWRYVMRQNVRYLSKVAHESYLQGLKKTGISLETIPHMYGMNRILKEIGWATVAVDGFIPPAAFMEFQANKVLVIAADIRPIDQIGYTSAPDIIHEAAGHAPIIADQAYSLYLQRFGEIGSKAISSANDNKIYEAIRHLSILKADPNSDLQQIKEAESNLHKLEQTTDEPSELALIRNLHWWTVEYGLIGDLKNPKIYGAGLLSSISESYYCMQPEVKKIPYSLDAINYSFDITEPQPQLFVTPDFETLTNVLEEFADKMAFRKGGSEGIRKAVRSEATATCVYSSGVQISGNFTDPIEKDNEVIYLKTTGPTNISYINKELPGHGKKYHSDGFGSPVGKIRNLDALPEIATDEELIRAGIAEFHECRFEFESGIIVTGYLKEKIRKDDKLLLLRLNNCEVTYEGRILFQRSWGMFDMAVGSSVISVFAGPADKEKFGLVFPIPEEKTHKITHNEKSLKLFSLYQMIRDIREKNLPREDLSNILNQLKSEYPEDWLLSIEILELLDDNIDSELLHKVKMHLERKASQNEVYRKLISDGLEALEEEPAVVTSEK